MAHKLDLLIVALALNTICLLGQENLVAYFGWPKDSILDNFEKDKASDKLIFSILENSKDKLSIEYITGDIVETIFYYFENNKLKFAHHDERSFNMQKDPISYFKGYIKYLNENPYRDLEIYLTYGDQTFTDFDYKNVDKAISLKNAQLHAISKRFGAYTEIVLLYVNGTYHLHKIFEDGHFDPWIKSNPGFKDWYYKNGYDKIFNLIN